MGAGPTFAFVSDPYHNYLGVGVNGKIGGIIEKTDDILGLGANIGVIPLINLSKKQNEMIDAQRIKLMLQLGLDWRVNLSDKFSLQGAMGVNAANAIPNGFYGNVGIGLKLSTKKQKTMSQSDMKTNNKTVR